VISYKNFLLESAPIKNLHLEHIEDEIFNNGVRGAREAINFLRSLRDMLSGDSPTPVTVTVKFDGAPAIFVGTDPADGKFFVGTKGVFNKNPKVIKKESDISELGYKGGLAEKLKVAFNEMKSLGIKDVLQGDIMFTSGDLEKANIDGETYTIFQPNTIVYAVPYGSDLDKKIRKAEIGVVFHTTYTGESLEGMGASFGADVSDLYKTPNVWYSDVNYQDFSGSVTMTSSETTQITSHLSKAGKTFHTIKTSSLDRFLKFQNDFPSNLTGATIKTYNNSKIRQGEKVVDPVSHSKGYIQYIHDYFNAKVFPKVKSEKGKENKEKQMQLIVSSSEKMMSTIVSCMRLHNYLVDAKMIIIEKLNNGAKRFPNTFVRTDSGYKVVNDEGYVAIDKSSGGAVKLVDRLEFSYNNFNGIKNWDK
jgi:hypothetical protein